MSEIIVNEGCASCRPLMRVGGKAISSSSNVLRRKLRNDPAGPDDQVVSPAKAARVSLARAADSAFNLALRVSGIRQNRLDLSEVVDQIDETWASFPLLHDDGSVGVMCIDPACIVAFVDQQTLGRVSKSDSAVRNLTRTDKALAMAFIEVFYANSTMLWLVRQPRSGPAATAQRMQSHRAI